MHHSHKHFDEHGITISILSIPIGKETKDMITVAHKGGKPTVTYVRDDSAEFNYHWSGGEKALHLLFTLLILHKFIQIEWDDFKASFIPNLPSSKKIWWLKDNTELPYLLDWFSRKRNKERKYLITLHRNQHVQTKKHFLDKDGKELKIKCLRTNLSKAKATPLMDEIIEQVLREVNA